MRVSVGKSSCFSCLLNVHANTNINNEDHLKFQFFKKVSGGHYLEVNRSQVTKLGYNKFLEFPAASSLIDTVKDTSLFSMIAKNLLVNWSIVNVIIHVTTPCIRSHFIHCSAVWDIAEAIALCIAVFEKFIRKYHQER